MPNPNELGNSPSTEVIASPSTVPEPVGVTKENLRNTMANAAVLKRGPNGTWNVSLDASATEVFLSEIAEKTDTLFDHATLVQLLGIWMFTQIANEIRAIENPAGEPWDEFIPTMSLAILLSDGTVSTRTFELYDSTPSEEYPDTYGISFMIQKKFK